jgi:exosortase
VLEAGTPRPAIWPVLLALPVMAAWVLANWLGLMEGRQLALVGFVEVLLMAAIGWRLWWALSPAFLYLVFLVPFGAFLTPALQSFTTGFILRGLTVLGVPFDANAFQITIPEGVFYVAEACAGLRFLIAAVAFGVLYAVTMFRSPWRRAIFIAVSCVVPVLANGIRGLGIVMLGHLLGSAEAGAADHLVYGWVFFSCVIVLLALAGLPFRQDTPIAPRLPTRTLVAPSPLAVGLACLPVLVVAAAGPALSRVWEARMAMPTAAIVPAIKLPPACHLTAATTTRAVSVQDVHCGASDFRVTTTVLPRGANPARILDSARAPATEGLEGDVDSTLWHAPAPSGAPWMVVEAHDKGRYGAFAIVLDHDQLVGGLHDRLRMAHEMLGGAKSAPITFSVNLRSADRDAMDQLHAFLAAQPDLPNMPAHRQPASGPAEPTP